MADPKLISARVQIAHTASDGYSNRESFKIKGRPEGSLLAAFEEMSRLLHLYGFGAEAMRRAHEAADRVAADTAKRCSTGGQHG